MLHLLQPIASVLIGVAMAAYGLIHAVTRFPESTAFASLLANLPAVTAVVVFLVGVVAVFVGVYLVVTGTRRFRVRWLHFNQFAQHTFDRPGSTPAPGYDDEREWDHAYR